MSRKGSSEAGERAGEEQCQPGPARAPYKSPPSKLVRFFAQSRDEWKAKCRAAKRRIKLQKNRLRFLEESRARWKSRAQALEREVARLAAAERVALKKKPAEAFPVGCARAASGAVVPAHHHYSLETISLFLQLVLAAATSLRCASRVLALVGSEREPSCRVPTWWTGRWWLLRVGYYKLTRPKDQAEDWVWIVDHTAQLGPRKCLLILGLRLSALPARGQCLGHEDVEPLVLEPVTQSTGEVVYQQLEATIEKTGVPREIISDHGGDVKAGIERFCAAHPTTCAIYDIKHKTAAILKQELSGDSAWQEFSQLCQQTKQQVQQTAFAFLMPPNQRTKARWMNVEVLVRWGTTTLAFLDAPPAEPDPAWDRAQLEGHFGWLTRFRAPLRLWAEVLQLVELTEHFVRTQGLGRSSARALGQLLAPIAQTPRTRQVRTQLLTFVRGEAAKAAPRERLLGSSEVIESIFGKLKRLEHTQAKSGFTRLILALSAMVATTSQEIVHQALETVSTRAVLAWCKETLGESLQAQRRRALSLSSAAAQNSDQEREAA